MDQVTHRSVFMEDANDQSPSRDCKSQDRIRFFVNNSLHEVIGLGLSRYTLPFKGINGVPITICTRHFFSEGT